MTRYIWQSLSWPLFHWDSAELLLPLGKARQAQGEILAKAAYFELKTQAEVLTEDAFTTAAIEGETINRDSIRSSIARRLGLPTAGLPTVERRVDGLVEMLIDAAHRHDAPLDEARLKSWHAALFPSGFSGLRKITVGFFRSGEDPMQVVSGPSGREKVHYEAPPARIMDSEIKRFLEWFRSPPDGLDGLIRAAIAHFWFVTIHPFQDGNGRIARAIADMTLAQDEKKNCRLYSMSAQIMAERDSYYRVLELTQKGSGDLTPWVIWFLECLESAVRRSDREIQKSMDKARLWQQFSLHKLNDRQRKVINRLFEAGPGGFLGGLSNLKYRGITKTTRETAKRDLADLVAKGILAKNAARGRSLSYELVWPQ
jgi:Fic family protein